ncbi:hypothetical protein ACIQAL_23540 [Pseudomonas sp. NPDC088368]|uniref:hypothetical protein n=1 Tax=Pseudomonas sp. NPDC088368 TaxID=3364453 RepID=UPI00380D61A5
MNILDMLGSSELGVLFIQLENETYTRCPHASLIELCPIYPEENIYELIVTSWRNPLMPLLRYRTGDLVEIKDKAAAAKTWREGEIFCIDHLHGRRSDSAIFSTKKKIVTTLKLDNAIALCEWQPEFYCLEKSNEFATLYYSRTCQEDNLSPAHLNFKALTKLLAPTKLVFQKSHMIQPAPSGKFVTLRSISDD